MGKWTEEENKARCDSFLHIQSKKYPQKTNSALYRDFEEYRINVRSSIRRYLLAAKQPNYRPMKKQLLS